MQSFQEFVELEEDYQELVEKLITFSGKAYPPFGNVVILAGGAGCYPKGTEFFDGKGWKPIEQYQKGDLVLQYDLGTGQGSLTLPSDYINLPVDRFYTIKNRRVNFTTSLNHKHLLINEKTGNYEIFDTSDVINQHNNTVRGNKRKLVTYFQYSGPGIDATESEIRLKIAILADGYVLPPKEPKIRISIKKERKIERLRLLLTKNNIEYKEYEENGFTRFEFKYNSKDKEFESYWYNCSQKQLQIVTDEILKWDGCILQRENRLDMKSFSTTSKKSRDFVQFAFSACGYDTHIYNDVREDRTDCYGVYINNSKGVGIAKDARHSSTTEIFETDSEDGRMYCFEVPTGFFIVRQNGKIFVSGNSGKGFIKDKLLGIEGYTFDVDELKKLASKTPMIRKKIKDETGTDLQKLNLKNPEDVANLHDIIGNNLQLDDKRLKTLYQSILTTSPERKPNLIFDVTLKSLSKLEKISYSVNKNLGYDMKNIHIVWIVNDIKVAVVQNQQRSRSVPLEILLDTHRGVSQTMESIVNMGDKLRRYMDGDFVVAFNRVNVRNTAEKDVDTKFTKSEKGGGFIEDANYFYIKRSGKPIMPMSKIDKSVLEKIRDYVPKQTSRWDL